MPEYIYKVVRKYTKNLQLLEKFGFKPYNDEEHSEEFEVIAKALVIPFDSGIVKDIKKRFEYFYKHATDEEKEEDFKDFKFNEDGTAVVTPEMEKEWTECQLCFYTGGIGKDTLFINAADGNQFYNQKVLDEAAKHIVDLLLENKVIYKARIKKR